MRTTGLLLPLLLLVAAGCANDSDSSEARESETPEEKTTVLQDAYEACEEFDEDDTVEVEDEGETLIIDTGEYGSPLGMACILGELDTSAATVAQVESTTAMMGVQRDTDDGLEYAWSYHPDNGLNMIVELVEDE